MGQTDDAAKVAVFLASEDSGWITGERFCVNDRAWERAPRQGPCSVDDGGFETE